MKALWADHVTWTRIYIMRVTSDLPDADAAAQHVLQNQVDIGNAVKSFYGDQAGEQLISLLNKHILIAANLLATGKAGDTAKFEDANQRWHENADQIAAFLNSANLDNWSLDETQTMSSQLDLTLEEASALLNADWFGAVVAYDKVQAERLQMAHMLTEGIVAQFRETCK